MASFKLVPPDYRLAAIAQDYEKMRPMFLDEPITFAMLVQQLAVAEKSINLL
jgi:hypothetical protein